MQSHNPALSQRFLDGALSLESGSATMGGVIQKSGINLLLLFISGAWMFSKFTTAVEMGQTTPSGWIFGAAILGFVLALAIIFMRKAWSILVPTYALVEGVVLGGLSAMFEAQFPGIAFQAILGTMGVFAVMLFLYQSRIIPVTEKLKMGVVAATGAVAVIYVISMIGSFFGWSPGFLHEGSAMGIGFSLLVIGIAAFNLLLDFDLIENATRSGAPKAMEWYLSFGLLVTMVWLYMEVLRLLAKLNSRD